MMLWLMLIRKATLTYSELVLQQPTDVILADVHNDASGTYTTTKTARIRLPSKPHPSGTANPPIISSASPAIVSAVHLSSC